MIGESGGVRRGYDGERRSARCRKLAKDSKQNVQLSEVERLNQLEGRGQLVDKSGSCGGVYWKSIDTSEECSNSGR